jgi:integrase
MSDLPVPVGRSDIAVPLASAIEYAKLEKADATRRGYASDWRSFVAFCDRYFERPLPARAEVVAAYLADLANRGRKASTVERHLSAIAYAHRLSGHPGPTGPEAIRATMRGIRRTLGTASTRKAPLTAAVLTKVLKRIPADTTIGLRDRALLLLAFAGGFRRSEVVDLKVKDIERTAEGIIVSVTRSKTDQEGRGRQLSILLGKKLKPVESLYAWLARAQIVDGPIFRSVDRHGNIGASLQGRQVASQRSGSEVRRDLHAGAPINGLSPEARVAARRKDIAPLVNDLIDWMKQERSKLSRHNEVAKAVDYMLKRIDVFTRLLEDGRICLSNNAAERELRGIALGRKSWLFAGSDRGGERAAVMLTLIRTAKLNDVDPQAWLADVLARLADHKISDLAALLPWNWRHAIPVARAA